MVANLKHMFRWLKGLVLLDLLKTFFYSKLNKNTVIKFMSDRIWKSYLISSLKISKAKYAFFFQFDNKVNLESRILTEINVRSFTKIKKRPSKINSTHKIGDLNIIWVQKTLKFQYEASLLSLIDYSAQNKKCDNVAVNYSI